MAKKITPASVVKMLERHQGAINYIDEVIRVKKFVPVENQAEHVRSKSVEYWIGRADGANAMMEDALFSAGCYNGYSYVDRQETINGLTFNPCIGTSHPEFVEWRREYHRRSAFAKAL